ncbi:MAG TPA: prolyl oligopeptidase family serine peptidase [Micropepsaceae bacterium]|jgi:prolyl oligopeptidase|nr:prolyl oligopeptidase family serine peptidase [Micropepsaceae bacterium]
MRLRSMTGMLAGMTVILGTVTAMYGADLTDDPYLWLEDVHGAKALEWVAGQNAISLKVLKSDPDYQKNYDTILSLLDADDRIPMGELHDDSVFNFWQDPAHVRGIWRRTTISSYETPNPQWDVLLDLDKLAADEGKSWVFKSANCSPDLSRCLISLSPGGGDTTVLREFDPVAKRFVEEGFALGEAKAEAVYVDTNTILFGTDFGTGTLTQSGYPRIVKMWRRGEKIEDSKIVFEGMPQDVIASPGVLRTANGTIAVVSRAVSFFDTEYFYVTQDGGTVPLPLPLWADLKAALGDDLIFTMRKDWKPEGQGTIQQGAMIAFPLKAFLADRKLPKIAVLYTPDARAAIDGVASGRDAVYAAIFENVTGGVHSFRPDRSGDWQQKKLALPAGGSPGIVSVNDQGPQAFFAYQGYLTPTTLFATKGEGDAPTPIKALPARFDASPYASTQYEAISKDGTKIPYFVVRAKDARGPMPMLLYGYGGFEISQTPFYWSSMGRVWLPKGGAYAVANIRGGGEFGPGWHEAALKTNRQKSYDDFIAVAEDMMKRGLTTPKQLGIMGGSNGGLLVGTVAVERPDLFAAVVCQVPLLDMMRFSKIGAGASWVGEYGDPDNPFERAAILRYSPYQNVKAEVKYPPIFFVTATSDDRVTPVHARKMAAKMEAQGHDVLFYENTEGGHAAAANHAQQAEMNALTYVYLTQKLGLK